MPLLNIKKIEKIFLA